MKRSRRRVHPGPAVAAEDLVLAYGDQVALDTSSVTLPRGQVTAIIGPNGSGKSTFLNAIAGLKAPVAGRISVLGDEPSKVRNQVSYVLQARKVNEAMPVTVREIVSMGRYASTGSWRPMGDRDQERIDASLDRLDIHDLATAHIGELSGGQRQRVFVAQGLAQAHELLLLDEPTTGLDLVSALTIEGVIRSERDAGKTVVVTTHDLGEAEAADLVVLMSGRVVAAGAPQDVINADNLAAAYGPRILTFEGDRLFVDDPAHRPVAGRHVHLERAIHPELPGSELH